MTALKQAAGIEAAPSPMLDHALVLAAAGWTVFPLQERSKEPYKRTRGLYDATTDAELIRKWWAIAPNSNIAIRPPEGVVVVDLDPRNSAGETLATLEPLPATLTARTGGGGLHAFYSVPAGLSWPAQLGPGVDLKSHSGYIVAAPSVHPCGAAYAWAEPRLPLAKAPEWLVRRAHARAERVTVDDEDDQSALTEDDVARVVAALEPHFVGGRKHHLAYAIGGWLRQRGAGTEDIRRIVEALPSRDPRARVKDALDGSKANQGWSKLVGLVGAEAAAALDAVTPNPRREAELAERAVVAEVFAPALATAEAAQRSDLSPPPLPGAANSNGSLPAPQASLCYDEQREHDAVDLAIHALSCSGAVYQRGGLLVHVARDLSPRAGVTRDVDAPRIAEMQAARVRDELSRHSKWITPTGKPVGVPVRVVEGVRARDEWRGLRSLRGLAEFPIVRADGQIVAAEGYDDATGVYVAPSCTVQGGPGEPAALARWLLEELVGDFPFATPAHRSAWLAALLTPLARYAFRGPTPLVLIDKNVRGSGGSLLADLIGIVVTGRALPRMSQAHNEEEDTKRLLGLAVAGDPIALLDNINQPLGNGALDRALTGTSIRERWLGGNQIVTAPWNCLLLATGNNVQLVGDTTRRALPVRLESPEERPEERANFRHTDVRRWALESRGWLLSAALHILAAHLRSHGPKPKPWGSFEGWSDVVRGAVIGCGLSDPCEGRAELVAVDSEAETARALIEGVAALGATSAQTARPIKEILAATASAPLLPELEALRDALESFAGAGRDAQGEARTAHRVGNGLRRYRGRVVGGRKLTSTNIGHGHVARWFVEVAQ